MPRGYMLLPFQAPRKLVMAVHLDQSVHLFVGPEELQRLIHRHLRYPHTSRCMESFSWSLNFFLQERTVPASENEDSVSNWIYCGLMLFFFFY